MFLDGVCLGVATGFVGVLENAVPKSWLTGVSCSSGSSRASLAASMALAFRVSVMLSSAYTKLMLVNAAYRR